MFTDTQGSGDLGRRVACRRIQLGLSVGRLAGRAHLPAGYIDHLEHHPVIADTDTLVRLAAALDTTITDLLGGEPHEPGRPGPTALSRCEPISPDEGLELLTGASVGRLVLNSSQGPIALPVSYRVLDGAIVFRTEHGTRLAEAEGAVVGFQVDDLDERNHQGWSVLVTGRARRLTDPATIWLLHDLIRPWAPGDRNLCLCIDPTKITGRRVTADMQEHSSAQRP